MAANQLQSPMLFGHPATYLGNQQSLALSAAGTWLAFQIVAEQTKTLDAVRLFLVAKNGTLAASDMTCDLYSDTSGNPGSSIDGPRSAGSSPAANNWVTWSGFTTELTAGSAYWLVFKNVNGTPGTNYPTWGWIGGPGNTPPLGLGGSSNYGGPGATAPLYGWNKLHTTNSASSWVTAHYGVACLRLAFSDSTYQGLPYQGATRPSNGGTSDRATGKQEVGVAFTLPAGAKYNVKGVWMPACKFGSPGALQFRLYSGTTLLGTTYGIPAANVANSIGDGYVAHFASAIVLDPASMTTIRVTMMDANDADASSAGYNGQLYTFDSDANSLILKPVGGTAKKTVTTDNTATPPSFTDTNADVLAFALLLDTAGSLTAASGSGGGSRIIGG